MRNLAASTTNQKKYLSASWLTLGRTGNHRTPVFRNPCHPKVAPGHGMRLVLALSTSKCVLYYPVIGPGTKELIQGLS